MKLFKIEENDSNQRLDRFLRKLLKNSSRSLIYKLNRKKKIKINGKKQKEDYSLQVGDEVKIFLRDEEFEKLSKNKSSNFIKIQEQKKLHKKDIVFEDSSLLVINKNSGVNVHPGDFKTKEISLIEQVRDYLGNNYNSLTFKPSLIHRIDRDTSGIILIAKKKDILTKLVKDFKEHKIIKKTYITYVFGDPIKKSGTINKKLLRISDAKNENKVQISTKGLKAITHYKVLQNYKFKTRNGSEKISKIEVNIETGRMHQIRVHLTGEGYPIVGDNKYGNKQLNSYVCKNLGLCRQALHASEIEIFHHIIGKKIIFKARQKNDIKQFLDKLDKF